MRLSNRSGRSVIIPILLLLLITALTPARALAQSGQQSSAANVQAIIEAAENSYRQGAVAHARGQLDQARKMFDQAVDTILLSGINIRSDAKLESYYQSLLDRIHKHEALLPRDDRGQEVRPEQEARPEVIEPSLLDEYSGINEAELATVTQDGVKIFGRYDFDFSVAPPVFQFMNYFVAGRGRSTMNVGLQRSGRYRRMVEKIFKEERVPLDLIWLAQAESVWKPKALSHAAAKGIWQFIPSTGAQYGLQQTSWLDDRSHPEKSTRAAARYLRWLHNHFGGDWLLAMAAYNSGENRVDRSIAKCGYADFWELYRRNLLPQETRNYVPIILSIIIISKNQARYGFNVTPDPPLNFDTFELAGQTDLKVIADLLSVPYEVMQDLNPELRRGASPPDRRYTIKLPKGTGKQFELAYANLPEDQRVRKVVIPREDIAEAARPVYRAQTASYQVRRGDTLAALARRHGVSVHDLARINRMSARGQLRKGQSVRIPARARAGRAKASRSGGRAGGRYVEKRVIRSKKPAPSRSDSKAQGSKAKTRRASSNRVSSRRRR